jgi:putative endonuclease
MFDRLWNKRFGRGGEAMAARYLKKRRYKIVQMNFTAVTGELDIIARKGKDFYVFVEVKRRMTDKYGTPAEAITIGKQRKIRNTASVYLQSVGLYDAVDVRFDVIEIMDKEINHIEGAF